MSIISPALSAVRSVFGRKGDIVSANGDYTASQVTNVPSGDIVATNVQDAIDELDLEKADVAHTHPLSDLEQSSATTGQIPTWNGIAWVPASPTSGVTDHTLLTNIGTNTHAQIDSHIANTSNPHSVTTTQIGAVPTSRLINTTSPITGGGNLTADRTIGLATSGVTPGSYTATDLTVDAYGRITSASNGSGGGGGSLWTDGGTVTYLTSTTDDVAIAGTNTAAKFFFDSSAALLYLNGGYASAQLEVSGGSYYATDNPNTDRHGQINIGGYPAFQGRIHYEGSIEKFLFIENSTTTGIKLRNNVSGTPVEMALFNSATAFIRTGLDVVGTSLLKNTVTVNSSTASAQANFYGWAEIDGTTTTQNGMISIGGTASFKANIQYDGSARKLYIDNTNVSLSSADTIFRAGTSGTAVELMRVRGTGAIGINSPTATAMLDVISSGTTVVTSKFRPAVGQTVDITQWTNSSGTVKAGIGFDNKLFVTNDTRIQFQGSTYNGPHIAEMYYSFPNGLFIDIKSQFSTSGDFRIRTSTAATPRDALFISAAGAAKFYSSVECTSIGNTAGDLRLFSHVSGSYSVACEAGNKLISATYVKTHPSRIEIYCDLTGAYIDLPIQFNPTGTLKIRTNTTTTPKTGMFMDTNALCGFGEVTSLGSQVHILPNVASRIGLIVEANASQTGNLFQTRDSSAVVQLAIAANGRDFILDTTTGTKIGTATSQKLAFFNKTPIVQQTGGAATASSSYTSTEQDMLQKVYDALRNFGFLS